MIRAAPSWRSPRLPYDGGVMERNPGWGTILGRPFEMRARQVQHSSGPAKSLETCAVTENQWAPPMSGEQR